jgi:hypothetical protein
VLKSRSWREVDEEQKGGGRDGGGKDEVFTDDGVMVAEVEGGEERDERREEEATSKLTMGRLVQLSNLWGASSCSSTGPSFSYRI